MPDVSPAAWSAITTLPDGVAAEALGEALERLGPDGVGVFEMEDGSGLWEVGAYFDAAPDGLALDLLAVAHGARPFAVSAIPPTDWVAKVRRELRPVEAGRFVVHGSHDAENLPAGCVPLLIEAAMAFGTGHHGTTQGCLLAFEALLAQGLAPAPVADIGAGTAVLAMAAAKVWDRVPIIASDIDAVAVEVAQANVAVNGLAGRVECVEAAGFAHPRLAEAAPFGLIFANILKGPLVDLAPAMAAHAGPGGHIILSGLLAEQGAEAAAAYVEVGFEPVAETPLGEWTTLTMRRA